MLFPEISVRSSSATTQTPAHQPSSLLQLSGTKHNFHRNLFSSNSQKNFEEKLNFLQNLNSPSSFHEEKRGLAKRILLKNSEKKFPKDFFENIQSFRNNREKTRENAGAFLQKTETNERESSFSGFYARNSQLSKKRLSEVPSFERFYVKKSQKNEHFFSNIKENQSFPQQFAGVSTLQKLENLHNFYYCKEFPVQISEKPAQKIEEKNPKTVTKSRPLRPIVLEKIEKSQSTQENSKVLTDNENEFLESVEISTNKVQENADLLSVEHKESRENESWGAVFTFYDKNFQGNKKEEACEENGNRKTGNFNGIMIRK